MTRIVALERPKEPLAVVARAPVPPGPGEVLLARYAARKAKT